MNELSSPSRKCNAALGIDIGGTFTDAVLLDGDGNLRLTKFPSNRRDPSVAVREILSGFIHKHGVQPSQLQRFIHGTTVATNEVLERKGARVGILATDGFTDILEIGRQNRQQLYDLILKPQTPIFLATGAYRKGVIERIGPKGEILTPLDEASLEASVNELAQAGVQSIAICFLFSFVNPAHEIQAAEYIRSSHPEIMVSLSSEVDPSFREYERTCCTAFDAYVKPGLNRYLGSMEDTLAEAFVPAPLQIMQSRGGICSSTVARRRPVRLFLSGPAAGVIGANEVGVSAGYQNLITVDIGGTSSDIALITGGHPVISPEGYVDGYKIRVPMIDVNAVGAGGGSIAWIDVAGGLRIGPESAGADPGPACYGRGGTQATVTDASVVLGLLNPDNFAGGNMTLNPELARRAIQENIAEKLGMSVEEAALGIHRVANVQMAEGIRLVSVRRGIDPRGFALVAFGGAGALHATALADELDIDTVIIPRNPGVLSAFGLLAAKIEHEVSNTYIRDVDDLDTAELAKEYAKLKAECAQLINSEDVTVGTVTTQFFADLCYTGQSHYLEVSVPTEFTKHIAELLYTSFYAAYDNLYGHHETAPVRLVQIRVVQWTHANANIILDGSPADDGIKPIHSTRKIVTQRTGCYVDAEIIQRSTLASGDVIKGPAIVEQPDTTVLIDTGWHADVDEKQVLIMKREA